MRSPIKVMIANHMKSNILTRLKPQPILTFASEINSFYSDDDTVIDLDQL